MAERGWKLQKRISLIQWILLTIVHQPRSFTSPASITRSPFKFTQTSRALHRTFGPTHIHESVAYHEFDLVFGDDLRKCQMVRRQVVRPQPQRREGPHTTDPGLLAGLDSVCNHVLNDVEERKSWI